MESKVSFAVHYNHRFVQWEFAVETAFNGRVKAIAGKVVSAEAETVLHGITNVDLQAMASFRNDTASKASGIVTAGFELYPLPYVPPTTMKVNGLNQGDATKDWILQFTIKRSPLVYVTVVSRPLSLMQLFSFILTTVLSFLGIWRLVFGKLEAFLQKKKREKMKRRGNPNEEETRPQNHQEGSDGAGDGAIQMQSIDQTTSTDQHVFGRREEEPFAFTNPAFAHTDAIHRDRLRRLSRGKEKVNLSPQTAQRPYCQEARARAAA